jgi:hypothetical protein
MNSTYWGSTLTEPVSMGVTGGGTLPDPGEDVSEITVGGRPGGTSDAEVGGLLAHLSPWEGVPPLTLIGSPQADMRPPSPLTLIAAGSWLPAALGGIEAGDAGEWTLPHGTPDIGERPVKVAVAGLLSARPG